MGRTSVDVGPGSPQHVYVVFTIPAGQTHNTVIFALSKAVKSTFDEGRPHVHRQQAVFVPPGGQVCPGWVVSPGEVVAEFVRPPASAGEEVVGDFFGNILQVFNGFGQMSPRFVSGGGRE